MSTINLLQAQTATGAGSYKNLRNRNATFQGTVSGTGAVTATINVEVSNDGVGWLTIGTISLSGTTSATDGFAINAMWQFVRGNVTAISGTSATVNLTMSE